MVTTVWLGYDKPQSLQEYAAQAALPIWTKFMGLALKNQPETVYPEPPGIVSVRIDSKTGLLADASDSKAYFEVFKQNNAPTQRAALDLDASKQMENNLY